MTDEKPPQTRPALPRKVYGIPAPHLRAWRLYRGMGLAELASATGVAKETISRYESGARPVSFKHLPGLAKALGLSREELLHKAPPQEGQA